MEAAIRKAFNEQFSEEKYADLLNCLQHDLKDDIAFRVAETPVFLDDAFKQKLIDAGDEILETILQPDFKALTDDAIPEKWKVAGDEKHPHFIAFDFAVCHDENGNLTPKLIELQGFPSLYGFQSLLADCYQQIYQLPENWTVYFSDLDKNSYIDLLKRTILGTCKPEEVVLMDVNAFEQKTFVDFAVTRKKLGLNIVALEDLKQEGKQVYYILGEKKVFIKRIYNRLIFDELEQHPEITDQIIDLKQDLNVEWITHPNWFYRISKYTMPFLSGKFVPKTYFLNKLDELPADLENYVLKPLFSFAGQGVMIDVTESDIKQIKDPENWILQQKVKYEPVVQAPDAGVKCEIRLLYLWPDGDDKPTLAINLSRLSRGKMIGVRYNKDYDWVGGTVSFFNTK